MKKIPNVTEGGLPNSPFFIQKSKNKAGISFNACPIPDRKWLMACKKALDDFLAYTSDENIVEYNKKIEDALEIYMASSRQRTSKRQKIQGSLYILKSNGLYKIGRTRNLKERLKSYITQNPFGIEVIYTKEVEDYKTSEDILLGMFRHKIVSGNEWFELEGSELESIISVAENL